MDWKPERAVQAKVRDLKKKQKKHDYWSMPREEHSAPVYKWRLFLDFWSTMGFLPKRHQFLPCTKFYTVNDSICSQ